jgi:hypothetical protein
MLIAYNQDVASDNHPPLANSNQSSSQLKAIDDLQSLRRKRQEIKVDVANALYGDNN